MGVLEPRFAVLQELGWISVFHDTVSKPSNLEPTGQEAEQAGFVRARSRPHVAHVRHRELLDELLHLGHVQRRDGGALELVAGVHVLALQFLRKSFPFCRVRHNYWKHQCY